MKIKKAEITRSRNLPSLGALASAATILYTGLLRIPKRCILSLTTMLQKIIQLSKLK